MRMTIYGINGVPISDSDVEHIQRFDQMRHTLPSVPSAEKERQQAEALGLSVEQFRQLNASLKALKR
ncbi:hypothetical protein EHF33_14250 [Deinococcus psychrotolerans]|uniref:Uncharacterized protein n=1 Tax=Deinococcus psychrotolerans TaxID=2489213 RepID=A0A3G8YS90_9DEIO|nr:hypothetical protein [Deinococcus psychrotolerans]AZI44076.1 hypothetical protein EHF33_14250 [Deinococcus psychrotolerans]